MLLDRMERQVTIKRWRK